MTTLIQQTLFSPVQVGSLTLCHRVVIEPFGDFLTSCHREN